MLLIFLKTTEDKGSGKIVITKQDGHITKTLLEKDLKDPVDIAVNPTLELLYVLNAAKTGYKLEHVGIDGKNRKVNCNLFTKFYL